MSKNYFLDFAIKNFAEIFKNFSKSDYLLRNLEQHFIFENLCRMVGVSSVIVYSEML